MRRLFGLLGLLIVAAVAPATAAPAPGAGATENRAVVVVELPSGETRSACVVFKEPSISGLDLLVAAQMDPKTYGMGPGAAVCKLCDEGCPQTRSGCLSCDGGKYWQYYRADGGGAYQYSNVGASSSEVTDGDVDGWRFGSDNKQPVLVAIETVCSDPSRTFRYEAAASDPPTTTSTGAVSPTTSAISAQPAPTTSLTSAPPSPAGARSPTTTAVPPATAAIAVTTTTTTAADTEGEEGAGPRPISRTGPAPPSDSSVPGLVAFALLLGGIVAWTIRARRARRAAGG